MSLNRVSKHMIDPDFVKEVDDNTTLLAKTAEEVNKKSSIVVSSKEPDNADFWFEVVE
jgi:hypothetical protein